MADYNGWTNYETWRTASWMDNDASSYDYYREMARDYNGNVNGLREALKGELEEELEELPINGLFADLLNAAFDEINFHEIAKHLIEEVKGSEENNDEPGAPEEGDYLLGNDGPLGCLTTVSQYGKELARFSDDEEAFSFIRKHMEQEQFWPNVWQVSDHGNYVLINISVY